ncbi:hypothetical protein MAH1_30380 [Sessilibacter sp. MAH1]
MMLGSALLFFYVNNTQIPRTLDTNSQEIIQQLDNIATLNNANFIEFYRKELTEELNAKQSDSDKNLLENNAQLNSKQFILTVMNQYNLSRVLYVTEPSAARARLIVNSFSLGASWYYQYSENGYTEETQVESINDALKTKAEFYHLCEKTTNKHWFFCTSSD